MGAVSVTGNISTTLLTKPLIRGTIPFAAIDQAPLGISIQPGKDEFSCFPLAKTPDDLPTNFIDLSECRPLGPRASLRRADRFPRVEVL